MTLLLTSSTRWDPLLLTLRFNNHDDNPSSYLLLAAHVQRLREAAQAHNWPDAVAALSYDALLSVCEAAVASHNGESKALKVRMTLSQSGELAATAEPIPPLRTDPTAASFVRPLTDSLSLYGAPMQVFLDTQPTPFLGLLSTTKTTERSAYNDARSRANLSLPSAADADADVLMYNADEHITEASVSNVACFRSGQWITPPEASGCLPGVLRRWLLKNKRIKEAQVGEITKAQMQPGDIVLLFNSVRGCRLARITAPP
ncbi:hypothetical protein HMN09_00656400 [Mycena chlorophos]|uniref:Uncharacterized protein n=2 Tax=Mycena chlorophos TaxID=658473 RepID=A0A146IEF2_MYCCL|nr:hypothetical protein HMN09_00656400 [Mycena chlorophos]GAT57476.1 predicted protein [Mycena chlorophos]